MSEILCFAEIADFEYQSYEAVLYDVEISWLHTRASIH